MHFTQMPPLFTLTYSLTFPLLYNKDIIVNLYKLHFPCSPFSLQLNKKVFHPPLFHSSNQTHMRENQIFYILPLFHPSTNFPSSHFSTPPTKRTLKSSTYVNTNLRWEMMIAYIVFSIILCTRVLYRTGIS